MQELVTIAQEELPVKIIVLNNGYLGMVRQWQELFFDSRYASTKLKNPDFVKLAEACGIKADRVNEREDLDTKVEAAFAYPGAFLLEVVVENEENVFPMVPPGAAVTDMILK
jgi:acetolactate synthase-1/2/3 large subunit